MDRNTAERITRIAVTLAAMKGTVRVFLEVLVTKLIKHDQRLSKNEMKRRGLPNIYRMGHLLGAKQKVEEDMKAYLDADTPEAMEALKQSLNTRFTEGFTPVKATIKQIDAWLTGGKLPRLK